MKGPRRRPSPTSVRALVGDCALAVFLFLPSIPVLFRFDRNTTVWSTVCGLGMLLPLVLRRRYPIPAGMVVAATGLLQVVARERLWPYDLAVLIVLYTIAAYRGRQWSRPALAVALLGAFLAAWRIRDLHNWASLVAPLVVSIAVWVLGDNIGTRRAYLAGLEERAARLESERQARDRAAVAEERGRIARDMHDIVSHRTSVIVAQAQGAAYLVDTDPEAVRAALQTIATTGREALAELRALLGVLRAADPAERTPQPGLADLDQLVEDLRTAGMPLRVTVEGDRSTVDTGVSLTVYRLVQEALTNTLKHAGPGTPAEVALRFTPQWVSVDIIDQGSPKAAGNGSNGGGHGLIGMRERVALHGGSLTAGGNGHGWHVHARLPAGPMSDQ